MNLGLSRLPQNVISLVGPSGSGKTDLICRLIAWFKEKGIKAAVLKHGHERKKIAESPIALDYRKAGAGAVALAGPRLVQITFYEAGPPDLGRILGILSPRADLVIVEGFKQSPLPKLAFLTPGEGKPSAAPEGLVAWVSREPMESPLPVFHPDELERIGAFILRFLRKSGETGD